MPVRNDFKRKPFHERRVSCGPQCPLLLIVGSHGLTRKNDSSGRTMVTIWQLSRKTIHLHVEFGSFGGWRWNGNYLDGKSVTAVSSGRKTVSGSITPRLRRSERSANWGIGLVVGSDVDSIQEVRERARGTRWIARAFSRQKPVTRNPWGPMRRPNRQSRRGSGPARSEEGRIRPGAAVGQGNRKAHLSGVGRGRLDIVPAGVCCERSAIRPERALCVTCRFSRPENG